MRRVIRRGSGRIVGFYATVPFRDDFHAGRLLVQLRYRPTRDPYAIELRFPDRDITWEFGRDILADGCPHTEPGQCGDVHVYNGGDHEPPIVHVALCLDGDMLVLDLHRPDALRFLDDAYASVPRGAESAWINWDAIVAALLRGGDR